MVKEFFKTILYQPLFNLLVFFSWLIPGHSVGWAIILLTILVKALLWKPQAKALRSPLEMKAHQDDIKRIQEQNKGDRNAQAQALMAFYRERGINPLSGCLPLLIQLPVILILYQVFIEGLRNLRPDLLYSFTPHLDTINPYFFGTNLANPDPWLWPLIAASIQFLQSYHYSRLNALPTDPNQKPDATAMMNKQMVFLFPIITFFIGRTLPAGLALYWAASTLFGYLQQLYVMKTFKSSEPKVQVTVRQKKKK